MRISDWSSDVCSSDLHPRWPGRPLCFRCNYPRSTPRAATRTARRKGPATTRRRESIAGHLTAHPPPRLPPTVRDTAEKSAKAAFRRSEERRVGKECVSTCRYQWAPKHNKQKEQQKNTIKDKLNYKKIQ